MGSAFIGIEGGGLEFLGSQSFLVNFKRKNENLNHRRERNNWPKWSVIEINHDL